MIDRSVISLFYLSMLSYLCLRAGSFRCPSFRSLHAAICMLVLHERSLSSVKGRYVPSRVLTVTQDGRLYHDVT